MEFYINHLTMEGCDANIASALLADNETRAEDPSSSSANVVYRPPFPLLETITEETLEELTLDMSDSSSSTTHDESSESPSSNSGRWGWGWGWLNTSDDDSSSVIHVPVAGRSAATITSVARQSELPDIGSGKDMPIWRCLVCYLLTSSFNRNLSCRWTRYGVRHG